MTPLLPNVGELGKILVTIPEPKLTANFGAVYDTCMVAVPHSETD